jgi:hypothetical protein
MRRGKNFTLVMVTLVALLLGSTALFAQSAPPELINYQGVLRDAAGAPRNGNFDMIFRFYDASSDGNLLLTDTHAASGSGAVTVTGGLFTAALGGGALSPPIVPFVSVFSDHAGVWLEIQVGSETLAPRIRVLSAAYAQSAHTLDGYQAVSFSQTGHTHDTTDVTSGTLAVARGGTGLAAPGTSGNVLMSNGTNWVSNGLPTAEILGAVVDASDTTLTRTGGGYSGNPYKLKLNLGNANTWTGAQTFGASTKFPGAGIWDSTGKVGIGTNTPDSPLQLSYVQTSHSADTDNRGLNINTVAFPEDTSYEFDPFVGLDCSVSGAVGVDADMYQSLYGIRSSTTGPDNWHETFIFGVEANAVGAGGATGLSANASGGSSNVGVRGHASGTVGNQYGVVATADGAAATWHCALEAEASGGSINWAGRFLDGDVHIDNKLSIGGNGNSPPSFPLDVQAAQAVARFTSTGNAFGSVLVLDNSTASPTYYGAINFNGGGGQIAYLANGDMTFKTNSTEHMRLTAGGWLGIGLTPGYQLQLLFDSAAKPTGGSWTNPSDRRLKKNIAPFTDGLAVITSINPVRYQLNGLAGMPLDSPGIGVIAQEIKDVAPYTVGTFKAKLNEKDEGTTDLYDFNASALTFVLINAVKELDQRTKSLIKDSKSGESASSVGKEKTAISGITVNAKTQREKSSDEATADSVLDPKPNFPCLPVSEVIEAGDVLVMDAALDGYARLSDASADTMVIGIAGGSGNEKVPVATSGFSNCKVDASFGPIHKGDLLVSSPTPGHAMKAPRPVEPGTIIGKALESLESSTGTIKVLVMLR